MRVFFSGYGLGIPLVQLVTFIVAYKKLTNKGKTSWDEKHNFIVSHGHIGGGRVLIYCVVFFVFLIISALSNIIFEKEMKKWVNAESEMASLPPAQESRQKGRRVLIGGRVLVDDIGLFDESYTDNGDGTVTDNNSKLMWQKKDDGNTYNWYQASGTYDETYNPTSQDVCGELILGGYYDWKLPSKNELASLVDSSMPDPGPKIKAAYFPNTKLSFYWSSTTDASYSGDAWGVAFGSGSDGGVGYGYKDHDYGYVRCMRSIQ